MSETEIDADRVWITDTLVGAGVAPSVALSMAHDIVARLLMLGAGYESERERVERAAKHSALTEFAELYRAQHLWADSILSTLLAKYAPQEPEKT